MTVSGTRRSPSAAMIRCIFLGAICIAAGCSYQNAPTMNGASMTRAGLWSSQELPWEPSLYATPTIAVKRSRGVVIAADQAPAGLSFVQKGLHADKTYLLTVAGQPRGSPISLRWVGDDGAFHYLSAPDGVREIVVEQTSSLEVLFYADRPFAYHLRRLGISECPSCLSDDGLRAYLTSELPGLAALLQTNRLAAAALLLDWTSNVADTGRDKRLVAQNNGRVFESTAAEIYTRVLLPNAGGYWCGGKSVFFSKILALFGFDHFTISFGTTTDSLNHVTVIVAERVPAAETADARAWRFFIFDPTFNVTFDTDEGDPVELRQLLALSRAGLIDDDSANQGDLSRLEYIVPRSMARTSSLCQIRVRRMGREVLCRNDDSSMRRFFRDTYELGPVLARNGFNQGVAGYFDLLRAGIFTVGGAPDAPARAAFIDLMQEQGIRVDDGGA